MLSTRIKNKLRRFHNDEEGLEAVQTVMIVAIAAMIMIAVMVLGQDVFDWLKEQWNELRGKKIS